MSVHVMSRNRVMVQSPPVGPSKGLLNGPGKNNCFLNCAVQVSKPFLLIFYENFY